MFFSDFDKSAEKVLSAIASISDVRDVALANLKAAQLDKAFGHQFIITPYYSFYFILFLIVQNDHL